MYHFFCYRDAQIPQLVLGLGHQVLFGLGGLVQEFLNLFRLLLPLLLQLGLAFRLGLGHPVGIALAVALLLGLLPQALGLLFGLLSVLLQQLLALPLGLGHDGLGLDPGVGEHGRRPLSGVGAGLLLILWDWLGSLVLGSFRLRLGGRLRLHHNIVHLGELELLHLGAKKMLKNIRQ